MWLYLEIIEWGSHLIELLSLWEDNRDSIPQPHMCTKGAFYRYTGNPRREPSLDFNLAGIWSWTSWPPALQENNCLMFKASSLWYFVIAAEKINRLTVLLHSLSWLLPKGIIILETMHPWHRSLHLVLFLLWWSDYFPPILEIGNRVEAGRKGMWGKVRSRSLY